MPVPPLPQPRSRTAKASRRRHKASACLALCLWAGSLPSKAAEPEWREPWQQTLTGWLKSLSEADVAIAEKPYDWTKLDPAEAHRNAHLVYGYAAPLTVANAALKLPAETFLWKELWRDGLEPSQAELKPYHLKSGQMWIPSTPTTADLLAWLQGWQRPWNPYYGDANVARRAAVISVVDLVMLRESVHYYTSGEELCRMPPFPPRACESGFSLTFNAFAFSQVKDTLPKEARDAWEEGLRWYADYNYHGRPGGPENMQLSAPVGVYYLGLALGDTRLKEMAEEMMEKLLAKNRSPAGYIRDAGTPDGSYNGISLHRLSEYWAISHSPQVLETLKAAYDLKQYLVLPEPDGTTLSPSHFNSRCMDGFDSDQYGGREVIIMNEVPASAYFVRKNWKAFADPAAQAASFGNLLKRPFARLGQARVWAANHRWEMVLDLPYVLYHGKDEAAMDAIVQNHAEAPVATQERYSKNFGNEFYCIRRPAYAAIFYAGPANPSDSGATNHSGMLKGEGGYLMGFAGGGLSAFWTPKSSSVILGRLTSYEAYERKTKSFQWGDYLISGWRDWLNNQVVGETMGDKILSSSRTPKPSSTLSEDGNRLTIEGVMLRKLRRQKEITDVQVDYKRTYDFADDGIDCTLELNVDKPLQMKSLYESLPVLVGQGNDRSRPKESGPVGPTTWRFLDTAGRPLEEKEERVEGVKTLELTRYGATTSIVFEPPVNFSMTSAAAKSTQMTAAFGRAFLIELPVNLEPGSPVRLRYRLAPSLPAHQASASLMNTPK